MRATRILVTGGAGFIGSHLVEALLPLGEVAVLDNLSVGRRENLAPHLEARTLRWIEGDICDPRAVAEAMRGCDVVFHCAVQCLRVSLSNPRLVHDVNATGTLNLLEAALAQKVKRFAYVSSSEVYGTAKTAPMDESHPLEPTTPYGASKLAGEMYAISFYRTYKLPAIVVRPFNTYGPRAHFEGPYGEVIPKFVLRALNDLPPVIFGDGLQARDFTYVTDTVAGLVLAAQSDALLGEVVNIACGREATVCELAAWILEILRKPHLAPLHTPPRPADVRRHFASIEKARKILGFEPRVMLKDGLRKYIEWASSALDAAQAIQLVQERNWSEALVERP